MRDSSARGRVFLAEPPQHLCRLSRFHSLSRCRRNDRHGRLLGITAPDFGALAESIDRTRNWQLRLWSTQGLPGATL